MSIRWRSTGELVCAAMSDEMEGDTYIDDRLHYQLSVVTGFITADANHVTNGLWIWALPPWGDSVIHPATTGSRT